ncbi:MAG: hypothetical protein SPJ55_04775 [Treponema sp.]|nr:hypothetical protein [Treponema sp.]
MDNNVTVLVNSCDAYEDTWMPMFKLLKKYWPDRKYPIVLNTETKQYDFEDMNIKTINLDKNKKVSWSKRLKDCLKKIDSKYILFMLDDFFIFDYVDQKRLDEVVSWLENDKNAAVFSFFRVEKNKYEDTKSEKYPDYNLRNKKGPYRFNCQAAIWRKDVLVRSLRNYESAWDWELIGNRRSRRYKEDFYTLISNKKLIFPYNYEDIGIVRGKWRLPKIDELFKKEGIKIDYSIRNDRAVLVKKINPRIEKIKLYIKKVIALF